MKKFLISYKFPFFLIFFSIGLGILPVVSAILSVKIAQILNCSISGIGFNGCLIGSLDFSDLLYNMFLLHWFGLITIPMGIIGVIVGIIILLIQYYFVKKKDSKDL